MVDLVRIAGITKQPLIFYQQDSNMTLPKCIVCEGEPLYRSYDHNRHSVTCYNCGYGIVNCTSERQAHTAWVKLNTPPVEALVTVHTPREYKAVHTATASTYSEKEQQ